MYQSFYGLRELPFELTSDPKYLFYTARYREALSCLQDGLSGAKAITVLVGDPGVGKTTLIHAALESEPCRHVQAVYLNNPTLTRPEFVQILARRFGLSAEASSSKPALLAELDLLLRERAANGITTALVVDEAQSLSAKLLEEVRLLANIETPVRKLLPVVLAGQPQLTERLDEPGLRQLKQRVSRRCQVFPYSVQETAEYVSSRITTAGGEASRLFTREAVMFVHEYSRGIPRSVNVLCDNALLRGMALGQRPVTHAVVLEVATSFDLLESPTADQPPKSSSPPRRKPAAAPRTQDTLEPVPVVAPPSRPSPGLDDLDALLGDPVMAASPANVEAAPPKEEPKRGMFEWLRRSRRRSFR